MTRRRSRRAARAPRLILGGLAGLVLALGAVELGLRATGLNFPEFWRSVPVLGLGLRPGASGWYVDEGRARVTINAAGFRDAERAPQKPAGGYRVLVLGDSFTESVQVPLEETFTQIAEKELATCPALKGRPVEVMNWGVRGYGTTQELELLKLRGQDFSPDAVVVANYPETDLLDNGAALAAQKEHPLIAGKGGALEFTDGIDEARRTVDKFASENGEDSAPALWSVRLIRAAISHWQHRGFWRRGRGNDPMSGEYPARFAYRPPEDETWTEAWKLQEGLLSLLSRETASRGEKLLLLIVSSPAQVFSEPAKRDRFKTMWGASDLNYPNARLAAFARRAGFEALDTVPLLAREAETTGRDVHGFPNTAMGVGHWNESGHRVVGKALAEKLCALASAKGRR